MPLKIFSTLGYIVRFESKRRKQAIAISLFRPMNNFSQKEGNTFYKK